MLSRHTNELMTRLERVEAIGCAEIRNDELLRWYGRDRITKNVWRDINDKWQEVAETDIPLLVGEGSGIWVLVYGKGLSISEEAKSNPKVGWLKDISNLG